MQRRAENHNVSDSLLLELFLQQLPSNVKSILTSISALTPQNAAEIADKILDTSPSQVSTISSISTCSTSVSPDSELLKELKLLHKEVAFLRRSRSNSRNRLPHYQKKVPADQNQFCWYHRKFASKAKKCVQPCSFPENPDGKE